MILGLLDDGDKIGSIVGGTIALIGLGWVVLTWLGHRLKWRKPITMSYLIPKANYSETQYEGAPATESFPETLTIGLGIYNVLLRFVSKHELVVDDAPWSFPGADGAVEDLGSRNPFVTNTLIRDDSRIHFKDWHGIWHNAEGNGPLVYKPGIVRVGGHRIRAIRPFTGELVVTFLVRGHKPIVQKLPFVVVEGEGDVPFLKETPESLTRQ